jgi:hypothetical protein
MSKTNPSTFTEWWQNLPIPWLVSGSNGTNEAMANGTVMDGQVSLVKQAAKVTMPGQAPTDALPHIGGDRGLVQGPTETNNNFITRLKTAWDDWSRAGTALELLVQIYWAEFAGAVIVTQNGLSYTLSGNPTAGVDPTGLLTIANTSVLPKDLVPTPPSTHTIPAGTPWWVFDSLTDFCSRFAVIFPSGIATDDASKSRLRTIINRWRPAKATCVSIISKTSGKLWGYPSTQVWGAATGNWGGVTVVFGP